MKKSCTLLLLVGVCVSLSQSFSHQEENDGQYHQRESRSTGEVQSEVIEDVQFGSCPYGVCVLRIECIDIIRFNTRPTTPFTTIPIFNGTTTVPSTTSRSKINCGTVNNPKWCCNGATTIPWFIKDQWTTPTPNTNSPPEIPSLSPLSSSQPSEEQSQVTDEVHFGTCPYGVCALRIECIDIIQINTRPTTPFTTNPIFNGTTTVPSTTSGSKINCGTVDRPKWCCNGATTIPSFIKDQWTTPTPSPNNPQEINSASVLPRSLPSSFLISTALLLPRN